MEKMMKNRVLGLLIVTTSLFLLGLGAKQITITVKDEVFSANPEKPDTYTITIDDESMLNKIYDQPVFKAIKDKIHDEINFKFCLPDASGDLEALNTYLLTVAQHSLKDGDTIIFSCDALINYHEAVKEFAKLQNELSKPHNTPADLIKILIADTNYAEHIVWGVTHICNLKLFKQMKELKNFLREEAISPFWKAKINDLISQIESFLNQFKQQIAPQVHAEVEQALRAKLLVGKSDFKADQSLVGDHKNTRCAVWLKQSLMFMKTVLGSLSADDEMLLKEVTDFLNLGECIVYYGELPKRLSEKSPHINFIFSVTNTAQELLNNKIKSLLPDLDISQYGLIFPDDTDLDSSRPLVEMVGDEGYARLELRLIEKEYAFADGQKTKEFIEKTRAGIFGDRSKKCIGDLEGLKEDIEKAHQQIAQNNQDVDMVKFEKDKDDASWGILCLIDEYCDFFKDLEDYRKKLTVKTEPKIVQEIVEKVKQQYEADKAFLRKPENSLFLEYLKKNAIETADNKTFADLCTQEKSKYKHWDEVILPSSINFIKLCFDIAGPIPQLDTFVQEAKEHLKKHNIEYYEPTFIAQTTTNEIIDKTGQDQNQDHNDSSAQWGTGTKVTLGLTAAALATGIVLTRTQWGKKQLEEGKKKLEVWKKKLAAWRRGKNKEEDHDGEASASHSSSQAQTNEDAGQKN